MKLLQNIKSVLPKSRGPKIATIFILIWLVLAIFDPIIETHLIGYNYDQIHPNHQLLPPLSDGEAGIHMLGTDNLGRDIAAGMVHGAKVVFLISFYAVFISLIFGLIIGFAVGFYGDRGVQKNIIQQVLIFSCAIMIMYYFIALIRDGVAVYNILPLAVCVFIGWALDALVGTLPIKKYGLALDILTQRLFELRESLPGIFIILGVSSIIAKPSLYTIAGIIGFLLVFNFARHARAEALVIKENDYIKAGRSSGMSDFRLILFHILPNALPTLLVVTAFSFSSVILLEASLSFLGLGIPLEEVSWGKILAEARSHPKAWWLAVFPGLGIFIVLFSFNVLGDYYSQFQRRDENVLS